MENEEYHEEYYEIDPVQEKGLFMDWVLTCFRWENLAPSPAELQTLSNSWYPGQAPMAAVTDIIARRAHEG